MHGSYAIDVILVCVDIFRGSSRMHLDALCLGAARLLTRVAFLQMMPLARLSITQFKVDIAPGARIGTLSKAYKAADITGKWNATSWAQGMAKKAAKAKMTDMDRFKMMVARKTVSITTPPTLPPLDRHISEK
jgi:hypothetical protein